MYKELFLFSFFSLYFWCCLLHAAWELWWVLLPPATHARVTVISFVAPGDD